MKQLRSHTLGCALLAFYTMVPAYIIIFYTNLDGVIGYMAAVGSGLLLGGLSYPVLLWLGLLEERSDH